MSIYHCPHDKLMGAGCELCNETYAVPALCMWTIYDHPRDCPDKFVVRQWRVGRNGTRAMLAMSADTLEAARALLPPGLYRLPREENDDPVIVESWI